MKVIAEIGVNHNGDTGLAKEMIHVAARCGADAVKFQTYDAVNLDPPGPRRDMLAGYQLSPDDFRRLSLECEAAGVEFMSTPFDLASLWFLVNDLGMKTVKIASGNLGNLRLLDSVARLDIPVIVSTGGADMAGVIFADSRFSHDHDLTFLHCVSSYPAPPDEINLMAIPHMISVLSRPIGLSDHSNGILAPILASAIGATVVEKHFTLDRRMAGPDHGCSLEPDEFRSMAYTIKNIVPAMMGDGIKKPQPSEERVIKIMRERADYQRRTP